MGKRLDARRDSAVDLGKALAICAVVCIHCSANRFALYEVGTFPWMANCFWGSVSRWAVAVFLLCSGAVMNRPERELSLKKLFSRYLLRLALALSVWAGLYELLRVFAERNSAPLLPLLVQAAKNWVAGNTFYHLYYFYYAFALYLLLPMTRLIAEHASRQELRYILTLWVAVGCLIPQAQYYWPFSWMENSLLWYILPSVFFAPGIGLLGWYLHQYPPKGWKAWLLLWLVGFGVTFGGTWWRSMQVGVLDPIYLSGFAPFVLMMAVGVFRLCQWWTSQRTGLAPAVAYLAQGSFCVYLIHPFFQYLTRQAIFEAWSPVWSVPLQVVLLVALSLGTYAVLSRIPVVNRWLI